MKSTQVTIPWDHGLHMIPASQLARIGQRFDGTLTVYNGERAADATSVMQLLMLEASAGTVLTIEADGEAPEAALEEVEQLFQIRFEEAG